MKPLVIYHDHCTDGFGAAFAAWCKLGDTAEYLPMSYGSGDPLRDVIFENREVYVLDFSFDKMTTEALLDECSMFVWLDHHKSAFEMWTGSHTDSFSQNHWGSKDHTCHIYLDQHRSGAMLAWEYFHPEKDVPDLIRYIDDRDRWVFKYDPNSRALHAGLAQYGFNFRDWADLVPAMGGSSDALNRVIRNGQTIVNVYARQIGDRVKVAEKCRINTCSINTCSPQHGPDITDAVPTSWSDGYIRKFAGLAVNSPIHQSEIGNELAKASGTYGLVWYFDGSSKRANVSLRSVGDYDVSAIAKTFGGGGHRNAAGFNIDMSTLLEWLK